MAATNRIAGVGRERPVPPVPPYDPDDWREWDGDGGEELRGFVGYGFGLGLMWWLWSGWWSGAALGFLTLMTGSWLVAGVAAWRESRRG